MSDEPMNDRRPKGPISAEPLQGVAPPPLSNEPSEQAYQSLSSKRHYEDKSKCCPDVPGTAHSDRPSGKRCELTEGCILGRKHLLEECAVPNVYAKLATAESDRDTARAERDEHYAMKMDAVRRANQARAALEEARRALEEMKTERAEIINAWSEFLRVDEAGLSPDARLSFVRLDSMITESNVR